MIALIFRHTRGSSLPPSKANQTWLWGPIGGGLRLIFASFVDWLSWPKCTLKNPVLSHNDLAVSERERWWEFTPLPPPSFFGYVSLEILLLPTRRPTSRQPELLPGPGDSRPSYLSKSRKRVFSQVSIVCFFYFAAFSTDNGLIESIVQRRRRRWQQRRRQRRQTECHQHFVVSTNCRSCYVSLVWASLLFELCHVSKNSRVQALCWSNNFVNIQIASYFHFRFCAIYWTPMKMFQFLWPNSLSTW